MLQQCYECDMRFFTDVNTPTRIRWYWTDPKRGFLPFPSRFGSSLMDTEPEQIPLLGEVQSSTFKRTNGKPKGTIPLRGLCGSRKQWLYGQPLPPDPPVVLADDGFPACCGRAGAAFDTGFDLGFDA